MKKENKPIASKPAKKRKGDSPIKKAAKVTALKPTGPVKTTGKGPNPQQVRKTPKAPAAVASNGDLKQIKAGVDQIIGMISANKTAYLKNVVASALPPARRDPLGDEGGSFDAAVFQECLKLVSNSSRAEVFSTKEYATALRECQRVGLDVQAMMQVDAVVNWNVADIERLISYLTTLCHIKRAVRSASETNVPSGIVK